MADLVRMPKLGFDMAEGRLVRWAVAEGAAVQKGQVLAEIETDKATVEVEATLDGLVRRHLVPEGESVPIGTPIAVVADADEPIEALLEEAAAGATAPAPETGAEPAGAPAPPARAAAPSEPVETPPAAQEGLPGGVRASPLARRLAEARGLDLRRLKGSGPGGRIVRRDLESATDAAPAAAGRAPVSRLRSIIARRMTQAKQQVPHFYVTIDIDAAPLLALREQWNALQAEDRQASLNDFLVRGAAFALRQVPNLNASLDGDSIVRHAEINVGVAVALEDGLITVVCRQADARPFADLSQALREAIARARAGKVRPEDIEGSTFSVSNLGMFGVDHFAAIINPPEAAILAVGGVRDEPVVRAGQVVPGRRMRLTVSADHRVTDGAEAARFLQSLRAILEQPLQLVV